MVKQARLASGVMPLSTVKPPTTRVDPNDDEVVEVTPNVSFSVLAKRKCDEGARVLGRKKSRTSFSFCALKEVVGLMSGSGRPSTAGLHDLPSAPLVVQAVAHVPSTPFSLPAQEVFVSPFTMTSLIVPLVAPVVVSASTIVMPLLSADGDDCRCFRNLASFFFSFTSSYFVCFGIGISFLLFLPPMSP